MDQSEYLLNMLEPEEAAAPPPQPVKVPAPRDTYKTPIENTIKKVEAHRADEFLKSLDEEFGAPSEEIEAPTEEDRGAFRKFFSGVGDAFVQLSRDFTTVKRDIEGRGIEDIPEPLTNDPNRSWVEEAGYAITKYGGAAVGGALLGSAVAPGVGTVVGSFAAPLALMLAEDPRTLNLADLTKMAEEDIKGSLNGTLAEDLGIVVDAISDNLAKGEGDSNFTKRMKNLGTDIATGGAMYAGFKAAKMTMGVLMKGSFGTAEKVIEKAAKNKGIDPKDVPAKATKEDVIKATKEVVEETSKDNPSVVASGSKNQTIATEEQLSLFEQSLEKEIPPSKIVEKVEVDKATGVRKVVEEVPEKIDPSDMKVMDEGVLDKLSNVLVSARDKYKELRDFTPVKYNEILATARRTITPEDRARILTNGATDLNDSAKVLVMFEEVAEDFAAKSARTTAKTEAEVLAMAEAQQNLMYMAGIYSDSLTDTARRLGFGKMINKVAMAGDDRAIEFIGTVGKYRAVNELIKKHGGKEAIENQAALFREVMIHSADDANKFSAAASKLVQDGTISEKVMRELIEESREVLAQSNRNYFMDSAGQVAKKSKYRTLAEGLESYLSANTLTIASPIRVLIETPTVLALRSGTNYVKSVGYAIRGNIPEASASLAEANTYVSSLFLEMGEAMKKSRKALIDGRADPNERFLQGTSTLPIDVPLHSSIDAQAMAKASAMRRMLSGVYGWSIGLSRRLLLSEDVAINHIVYEATAKSKIVARGVREGLSGRDLSEYVERSLKDMPDDIHQFAVTEGQRVSLYAQPEFVINEAIEYGMTRAPGIRAFNLFFRTRANSIERTMEYFPGASVFLKSQREAVANMRTAPDAAADVFAKQALGSMIIGSGYLASEYGLVTEIPPKGIRDLSYWSENIQTGKTEGFQPGAFRVGGQQITIPEGTPLAKLLKIGHYLKNFADRLDDDQEVEALGDLAINTIATMLDEPGRYQSDLEFFMSLVNQDFTKQTVAQGVAGKLTQLFPLAPQAMMISKMTSSDPYMRDLRGSSNSALDYTLEVLENRYMQMVESEGLLFRRNIMGEPIVKTNFFMGLSSFSNPKMNTDPSLEKLRAFEMYGIEKRGLGFTQTDLQPPRNIFNIEQLMYGPSYAGADTDPGGTVGRPLPNALFEKFMDYYAGMDMRTGQMYRDLSLREHLSQTVDRVWEDYKADPTPLAYNIAMAEIKEVLSGAERFARDMISNDPEFQDWFVEQQKDIYERRQQVQPIDVRATEGRVNKMLRSR